MARTAESQGARQPEVQVCPTASMKYVSDADGAIRQPCIESHDVPHPPCRLTRLTTVGDALDKRARAVLAQIYATSS